MYITADAQESVLSVPNGHIGSGRDTYGPRSIESVDVKKTGLVYTKTPDTLKKGKEGRERLLDFLDKVEANIAKEVAARKKDISNLRAQMAKNMEFNQAARSKMKKMLLKKMAENAKIAKDDLAKQMRWTHKKFADTAEFESKRNKATIARSKKTREIMSKNKREGAKALHHAVLTQQKALAALDAATNAKIKKTNAHIAANAAQIKTNAKKAKDELDHAMNRFDHKMANVQAEAKAGRSKLAAQAAAMDKKFREYANNKIKAAAAKTASQFAKVRDTMAKDRAHADAALAHTSAKMDAALSAQKALQDKRFAQTVSDIAAAKKEANDRVNKFKAGFKADILKLSGVVQEQTTKLNKRVSDLSATVTNNRLEQAKVNHAVDAELKRITKVGNDRYKEHLKKDKELHSLMAKNRADTEGKMKKMSLSFFSAITKIKDQMAKDRASHEHQLSKTTGALFSTLAANKKAQDAVNKGLTAATRAAEQSAANALKDAKAGFSAKLAGLSAKVKSDEQKHNGKVMKLTGVVAKNAIKDAKGRAELKKISDFNKRQLKTAIHNAVAKGEARALQLEKHMKDVNKKTRASLNNKITTEIGQLTKKIHSGINELQMNTKAARAQMKKQIMHALKEEVTLADQNLKKMVTWAEGKFTGLNNDLMAVAKKGAAHRAALKATIARNKEHILGNIANAVATQEGALLAYAEETRKKIKKTNTDLNAHAKQMAANAAKVAAQMKSNEASLIASLESARKQADTQLGAISAASAARYNSVVKAVEDGIKEAGKKADDRFVVAYTEMAKDREEVMANLGGEVSNLNKKIASAAALEDARFSKTVKDLKAARAQAAKDVQDARKMAAAGFLAARATAKKAESALVNSIQDVSGMIVSDSAAQLKVNNRVNAEMGRILKMSNDFHTESKRARGVIKKIMDENKAAAAEEVEALAKRAMADAKKLHHEQKNHLSQFQEDLTQATDRLSGKMIAFGKKQAEALGDMKAHLASAKDAAAGSLDSAKKTFASRLTTLTNAVTANAKYYENRFGDMTGIVQDWKKASKTDRAAIRMERKAMVATLNKKLARAISLGEAKRKAVAREAMANTDAAKKALLTTISASVESMADNVFATVQGHRGKIADNYLSLKAYCASAADLIADYMQKGKTRNLSSIGDMLSTLVAISHVKTKPAAGEGFGGDKLPLIFSAKSVKVNGAVSKINGLVNEYVKQVGAVKDRWPMGLGKYLIARLEIAMQSTGALEVDKVEGKSGNYVFMNAHSVGLSSKLSDFEGLAVKMHTYEHALGELTGKLSHIKKAAHKNIAVGPPEWQGN